MASFLVAEVFERLVRVFDHDDGRIHHRSDGDGDAAQGHNVRCDLKLEHWQEGEKDRDGERNDRYERRADVAEEDDADQCHNDTLLISFSRSVSMERLMSWLR